MVYNFKDIIEEIQWCRKNLASSGGIKEILKSIDGEVAQVRKILATIDNSHAQRAISYLKQVSKLINTIQLQGVQNYDERAVMLEKRIRGEIYSEFSEHNTPSESSVDSSVVCRGSSGEFELNIDHKDDKSSHKNYGKDHHTQKSNEPIEAEKPNPRRKREEVTTATEADAKNHVYHESGINNVREVTNLTQARQELHDLPDGYGKTTGYFRYEADPMKGDALQGGGLEMEAPDPKDVFDQKTREWTGRKVGRTKSQNDDLKAYVEQLKKEKGIDDIRIDQQQVDVDGRKVGSNRPDLQFTLKNKRYYVEWDRTTSGREIGHAKRIAANDPNHGGIELRIVDPYKK